MTIDIERLKTDAAYWDERGAPEDAAHVGNRWNKSPEKGFGPCWYREEYKGFSFMYPEHGTCEHCAKGEPAHAPVIRRPTRPAAPEWDGEGLPPVGIRVEFRRKGVSDHVRWSKGTPEAIKLMNDNPSYCIWMMEHTDNGSGFSWQTLWAHEYCFRPIRTAEQRQREELKRLIADGEQYGHDYITDAIIAAGWRKED